MPKAGYSGMGHHYVMMSKLIDGKAKEKIPLSSYIQEAQMNIANERASLEIDEIIRKVRESSLERRRHENTLALAHAAKGRAMSK